MTYRCTGFCRVLLLFDNIVVVVPLKNILLIFLVIRKWSLIVFGCCQSVIVMWRHPLECGGSSGRLIQPTRGEKEAHAHVQGAVRISRGLTRHAERKGFLRQPFACLKRSDRWVVQYEKEISRGPGVQAKKEEGLGGCGSVSVIKAYRLVGNLVASKGSFDET